MSTTPAVCSTHIPNSSNGQAYILDSCAQGLANYPHARKANGFVFVSGVEKLPSGEYKLDIGAQTRGVISNLAVILKAAGCSLKNVIDITVFLVDMSDYAEFNKVYNEFFQAETGPSRTTVAVKQLPNPNLLIEIKAVALAC
ncbi:hypothetical protein BSLG_002919 [Batrachochytrium salamandrivorans]|nr:hypothetical protein BSLG_002919 [Batrachochytrium salamandrivorans]